MTTNADAALLIQGYYKIAAQLDEVSASFIDAAPGDPARQIELQSKLMAAVIGGFMQSLPALSPSDFAQIFAFASQAVAQVYEHQPLEPSKVLN